MRGLGGKGDVRGLETDFMGGVGGVRGRGLGAAGGRGRKKGSVKERLGFKSNIVVDPEELRAEDGMGMDLEDM